MDGDRGIGRRDRAAVTESGADRLFNLLIGVYLGGGLLTSMVALLVPRETVVLGLGNAQAMCIQLAFYSSYLLFALPIALLVVRIGYMRAIASGLAVMALGCMTFTAAQARMSFPLMLAALLVMSSGVTVLQIAGNAVTRAFGAKRMAARYTFLQALNSVGTVAAPLIASHYLLGEGGGLAAGAPFLAISAALLLLSLAFLLHRKMLPPLTGAMPSLHRLGRLLYQPKMQGGIVTIFVYVGAEVTVAALIVGYLMMPGTIAARATEAGWMVSLYWAGAMAGRFAGSMLLRRIRSARLLAIAAVGAIVLLLLAIFVQGAIGAAALLGVGLCNSVMYPLVYTLTQPRDDADAPAAAMLLCMAVVGGAVIPVLAGATADLVGLAPSLFVPLLCYAVVLGFGLARMGAPEGSA
jgi:MFS transporter, FHS family, L-fucose permease